jgi:hypothetical protein
VVRHALELAGIAATEPGGVQQGGPATVSVAVRLQGADGTVARLSVVARLDPNSPGRPAAILSWEEPDDDG